MKRKQVVGPEAPSKPLVVLGLVGTVLDGGGYGARAWNPKRWARWRPSVDLTRHPELPVARLELLHTPDHKEFAEVIANDVPEVSRAVVRLHPVSLGDAWDFESVYGALFDFCKSYPFRPDDEDYLIHITTGTHVAQICWFLLAEAKHAPANLLQTSPPEAREEPRGGHKDKGEAIAPLGRVAVIDLDLSRYDRLRQRFALEQVAGVTSLKQNVPTRDTRYNALIAELEVVASSSPAPILLLGPTGSGKTQLARRIYELKRARHQVEGPFVEVNCATLRGDGSMSTLFGHKKGAFTGAIADREGLLKRADGGVLFLDEIGELGMDEQAMLLRALEERRFLPMGADKEASSSFQFLCGTHRDLRTLVAEKRFREDLLARIDIWSFALPALRERRDDIAPNLEVELERVSLARGRNITMNREARTAFLAYAIEEAQWPGNFREFAASIERMATLCHDARIARVDVDRELARKRAEVGGPATRNQTVREVLGDRADNLDDFDEVQLAHVIATCRASRTLAEAGRKLFQVSRTRRAVANDSDRLRKYLVSFDLTWDEVAQRG